MLSNIHRGGLSIAEILPEMEGEVRKLRDIEAKLAELLVLYSADPKRWETLVVVIPGNHSTLSQEIPVTLPVEDLVGFKRREVVAQWDKLVEFHTACSNAIDRLMAFDPNPPVDEVPRVGPGRPHA